jgi:hypothetical protein
LVGLKVVVPLALLGSWLVTGCRFEFVQKSCGRNFGNLCWLCTLCSHLSDVDHYNCGQPPVAAAAVVGQLVYLPVPGLALQRLVVGRIQLFRSGILEDGPGMFSEIPDYNCFCCPVPLVFHLCTRVRPPGKKRIQELVVCVSQDFPARHPTTKCVFGHPFDFCVKQLF